MPSREQPWPDDALVGQHAEYYYRRRLGVRDLLPAVGIAIGAGLFAFYVTRLLMQRTPLIVDRRPRVRGKDAGRQREA